MFVHLKTKEEKRIPVFQVSSYHRPDTLSGRSLVTRFIKHTVRHQRQSDLTAGTEANNSRRQERDKMAAN